MDHMLKKEICKKEKKKKRSITSTQKKKSTYYSWIALTVNYLIIDKLSTWKCGKN